MRREFRAGALLGSAVLLAGCAAMPDGGTPPRQTTSANDAQQVVVVAEPPKAEASPDQLLSGFLDDLVSDDSDYQTAKLFLSPNAAKSWNPEQSATVLQDLNVVPVPGKSNNTTRMVLEVSGTQVATLDARHAFTPSSGQFKEDFTFTKAKGSKDWTIDKLPDGLVLKKEDFQRIYESVDVYFPIAGQSATTNSPLVADPVYVRSHIDPLTDAANILFGGSSAWLAPAVQPGFPNGTALSASQPTVQVGSDGTASVRLNAKAAQQLQKNSAACYRMAAQLFFTLAQVPTQQAKQAGQTITGLNLYAGDASSPSCVATKDNSYSPVQSVTNEATMYFVDASGHLSSLDAGTARHLPVQGQPVSRLLAPVTAGAIGGFAVAPDVSGWVAVLSHDQKSLYVSSLTSTSAPTHAVLTDSYGFGSLSWDSLGTLWTVSNDPSGQGLGAVEAADGGDTVVPVTVQGLKGRVTEAKVAADGARIVLTVIDNGTTSVQVGRIQRSTGAGSPELTVAGLHSIVPDSSTLTSVKSLSWNDGDSIIVLGQQATTGQAPSVWDIDGSSGVMAGPQAPSYAEGMGSISALQQDPSALGTGLKAPYLGDASGAANSAERGKVYRWEKGGWEVLTTNGSTSGPMPSYPG